MKGTHKLAALILFFATQMIQAAPSVQTKSEWGSKCENDPVGLGMAPLVAILAPFVVDAIVDHTAASIKAASDSEVKQFPVTSSTASLYEINKIGEITPNKTARCLTVIRGEFEGQKVKKQYLRLEIGLEPIAGTEYFRLEPHYLKVEKLEVGNWFSKTGDYSFSVSLYPFGSTTPFGSATFNFEKIKQGTEIKLGDYRLISVNSDPIKFPSELEDAKATQEQAAKEAAPYLLALGALKKKQKYDAADAAHNPKPNQYDVETISKALESFCNAEANDNARLPVKDRTRSDFCAITKNAKKRELDKELNKTDYSEKIQSWAKSICNKWDGKQNCNAKIDNPQGEQSATGNFISKTIITETRNANIYGQKLASILGAASEEIKTKLKSKLPNERKQAEEQEDADKRKAEYDYSLKLARLKSARNAYNVADSDGKFDANIHIVEACYAANEAAIAIGKDAPCPQYE